VCIERLKKTYSYKKGGVEPALSPAINNMESTQTAEALSKELELVKNHLEVMQKENNKLLALRAELARICVEFHLHESEQQRDDEEDVMAPSHKELIQKFYRCLAEKISAQPVATQMFACRSLTKKQFESIQSKRKCSTEAVEMLLDVLLHSDDQSVYQSFLEALRVTNQEEVYGFLVNHDQTDSHVLDMTHTNVIQRHFAFLLEEMDAKSTGLVGNLFSCNPGVLTMDERDQIQSEGTSLRCNERLLLILGRKSGEQFQLFLEALDNTGQSHIRSHISRDYQ
jgi:hypothetical protein